MSKKRDSHRADLIRRLADIHAQLYDVMRSTASAEETAKKRQELEQALAEVKKQLLLH